MEIVLIQVFFLTVGSKQKNNKNAEYLGTFIPFESQLYSKSGSFIFFFF